MGFQVSEGHRSAPDPLRYDDDVLAQSETLDESIDDELTPGEPVSEPGQVLVGDGVDNTGESTQEVEMTVAGEHSAMADITQLILDDHETFRREFAALDDADEPEQLRAIWEPLAALLDLHAAAEEAIFYPQLLRRGDDAEAETVDAIGDHNDIRDEVREAARHPIGSSPWWDAVRKTRAANSDHMAEEEDDALADFRRNAPLSVRVDLGHQFLKFKTDHSDARDLDTSDKDPQGYVDAVQEQISPDHSAHHLES
jgi:hypothetical protein